MSEPTVLYVQQGGLPRLATYIGYCCREWVMPIGSMGGSCGLCHERPTFLRDDPNSPHHDLDFIT